MIDPRLEQPKSSVDGFELPCGFLDEDGELHTDIIVREMTGEEEEILAARNLPNGKKYNRVLSRCTSQIGGFNTPQDISKVVMDLPQGDRVYLLFAIRRTSLGDEMPFVTKCPGCETESQMVIDLSELEIKKMPDPKVRTYDTVLPSGKKAQMKILVGRGEDMIAKAFKKGVDVISTAILARLAELDGEPPTIKGLKKLTLKDRNHLKNIWEDYEGGVDTTITIDCPLCEYEYEADIGIGDEGFFNPSAALKSWKKKSSI